MNQQLKETAYGVLAMIFGFFTSGLISCAMNYRGLILFCILSGFFTIIYLYLFLFVDDLIEN